MSFFAVDRRSWAKVCGLGSMNAAVAYLVMARGALKDHRTTSWSTNVIEKRTGIARPRAKAAIHSMIAGNLARRDKGGKRPRYRLLLEDKPEWIWLPNAIVDGAAKETPPVELVRQTADIGALRLFIDLYFGQALQFQGGVHWRIIRRTYKREKVGEHGEYIIWGFSEIGTEAWPQLVAKPFLTGKIEIIEENGMKKQRDSGIKLFWDSLNAVDNLGLFKVGHLINSDADEGEVIHPYAMSYGETGECDIARSAHDAAMAMMTDWQRAKYADRLLVPVKKHIANVQLVGLLRMTYLAQTAATRAWFNETRWQEIADGYRNIGGQKALSCQSRTTAPAL